MNGNGEPQIVNISARSVRCPSAYLILATAAVRVHLDNVRSVRRAIEREGGAASTFVIQKRARRWSNIAAAAAWICEERGLFEGEAWATNGSQSWTQENGANERCPLSLSAKSFLEAEVYYCAQLTRVH